MKKGELKGVCINCGDPLQEVFPGSGEDFQYLGALDIRLDFAHGQFHDHDEGEPAYAHACFCFECSVILCKFFPGIRLMLNMEEVNAETEQDRSVVEEAEATAEVVHLPRRDEASEAPSEDLPPSG